MVTLNSFSSAARMSIRLSESAPWSSRRRLVSVSSSGASSRCSATISRILYISFQLPMVFGSVGDRMTVCAQAEWHRDADDESQRYKGYRRRVLRRESRAIRRHRISPQMAAGLYYGANRIPFGDRTHPSWQVLNGYECVREEGEQHQHYGTDGIDGLDVPDHQPHEGADPEQGVDEEHHQRESADY